MSHDEILDLGWEKDQELTMKASMCLWGKVNLLAVQQRLAPAHWVSTEAGLLLGA
ncbi:hypothetical protein JET66_06880 [Pseudomonas putida]|uniref:hypothetical protein n=1 Tax=Pseudomonas putida TaxID=303 RepID=UPI0018E6C982|nr:hypothetical protein [Pseudomonas putida]MBI6924374.1 hypothetical protein [Pseudomonas putida]